MSTPDKPTTEHAAQAGAPRSNGHSATTRRWTLVAAILGSSLALLDSTVVNVSLPALQRALNASASQVQWVMEAYTLLLASLLLAGGALGDRFGRRRLFVLGTAIFTLASALCSLATSIDILIVGRVIQGAAAALVVPGSLSLISAVYPPTDRGAAIGTWSAFSSIAAAIGPVLGGFFIDHLSWHWAFLINLPLGVALCAVCLGKVPESLGDQAQGPVDLLGTLLVTVGLACLVFAFIEAPEHGWSSPLIWITALAGALSLLLFVHVERLARSPMLPLPLFRKRAFAGTNLLTLLLYAALGGSLFFLPLNLIQVQGYGATVAGATFLPFIAIMFALSRWAGGLADRFGPRLPLVVGPVIASIGFAMLALPAVTNRYWLAFFPPICVLGLGMSITVAPLTTTVMNSVGEGQTGTASGVNNAVARTGTLLAIALFGSLQALIFEHALPRQLATEVLPQDLVQRVLEQRHKLAGIVVPDGYGAAARTAARHAIDLAFVSGFRAVMLISAGLAILSALCAGLWIRRQPDRD